MGGGSSGCAWIQPKGRKVYSTFFFFFSFFPPPFELLVLYQSYCLSVCLFVWVFTPRRIPSYHQLGVLWIREREREVFVVFLLLFFSSSQVGQGN